VDAVALRADQVASPKLKPGAAGDWYDYYAGYSAQFVRDVLDALAPAEDAPARVLDPWNGSGTTTAVATAAGHHAVGVDRNPALVAIARGRQLAATSVRESIGPLRAEIVAVAKPLVRGIRADGHTSDELHRWFTPTTAARLRALERAAYRVLADEHATERLDHPVDPGRLSPLAAFFYCAMFTVVRQLTSPFRTSNPTWVRVARDPDELLDASWPTIEANFERDLAVLANRLTIPGAADHPYDISEGSADDLQLVEPADVVLTSPPYCTRIDYAIATRPELALLGHTSDDITRLRRSLLGSPLTESKELAVDPQWGSTACAFLEKVRAHSSKAADTYYLRYYARYVRDLFRSITAIDGVTRPEGFVAVVVQDSHFKEVHLDLPTIVAEMGARLGRPVDRLDFPIPRTKAAIHPGARAYRSTFTAVESLVVLAGKEAANGDRP
jgi:SAM-dependent methyltransferase